MLLDDDSGTSLTREIAVLPRLILKKTTIEYSRESRISQGLLACRLPLTRQLERHRGKENQLAASGTHRPT